MDKTFDPALLSDTDTAPAPKPRPGPVFINDIHTGYLDQPELLRLWLEDWARLRK